jgi:hypothetical protein
VISNSLYHRVAVVGSGEEQMGARFGLSGLRIFAGLDNSSPLKYKRYSCSKVIEVVLSVHDSIFNSAAACRRCRWWRRMGGGRAWAKATMAPFAELVSPSPVKCQTDASAKVIVVVFPIHRLSFKWLQRRVVAVDGGEGWHAGGNAFWPRRRCRIFARVHSSSPVECKIVTYAKFMEVVLPSDSSFLKRLQRRIFVVGGGEDWWERAIPVR